MDTLEIVKQYHELGFLVWPLRANSKQAVWEFVSTPVDCFSHDLEKYQRWFEPVKNYGVALYMGHHSNNVIALDFDNPKTYADWAASYPEIAAKTATAKTHKGYHVLLKCQNMPFSGKAVNNQAIDVIAEGWYICVWPSVHPKGEQYQWVIPPWEGIAEIKEVSEVGIQPYEPAPDYGPYDDDEEWCYECHRPLYECNC